MPDVSSFDDGLDFRIQRDVAFQTEGRDVSDDVLTKLLLSEQLENKERERTKKRGRDCFLAKSNTRHRKRERQEKQNKSPQKKSRRKEKTKDTKQKPNKKRKRGNRN